MASSAANTSSTDENKLQHHSQCRSRYASGLAAASVTAVAAGFALLLLFGATFQSTQPVLQRTSSASFCDQLEGSHLQFCNGFAGANGEDKFLWAQNWRLQASASCKYLQIINVSVLQAARCDEALDKGNSSSWSPATNPSC
jgi:hypothetical protein